MGIETYLTVFFWIDIARIVIFALILAGAKYPRKIDRTIGGDLVGLLVSIALFVWICFLKFGVL